MCICFGDLAVGTSQDKSLQEGGHSWPPIVLLHLVGRAEESCMSPSRGFMESFYEVMAFQFGDIELVFEV